MAVHFIKMQYRFTYFDEYHNQHIFDFIQYTDSAAIRTVDEMFCGTDVVPVSLYNNTNGIVVLDENSKLCKGCAISIC